MLANPQILRNPVETSGWQGYGKPLGLEGKGSKGKGQGRHLATLEKPLPLPRVLRVRVYYIFQIFILKFILVWFIIQLKHI